MTGLQRIILIDTHLPGVAELDLRTHTNLCGTNASGKTTLQRLIPVFYGERVSAVVPHGRRSFARWYLPRLGSYIVYEYIRENGETRLLVLNSTDGDTVQYRFVSGGFNLALFKKHESASGKAFESNTSQEFNSALKMAGISSTRLLSTAEAKAIIQNDAGSIRKLAESKTLRVLAAQYSLPVGGEIQHIEKLISAVHTKDNKMDAVKTMVSAILEENGVAFPDTSLNPKLVDEWSREVRLFLDLKNHTKQVLNLEVESKQHAAQLTELTDAKRTLLDALPVVETQVIKLAGEIDEINTSQNQLNDDWDERRGELDNGIAKHKADISQMNNKLDGIEKERLVYEQENVEQIIQDLKMVDDWQQTHDQKATTFKELQGQADAAAKQFDKNVQHIKNAGNQRIHLQRESKNEAVSGKCKTEVDESHAKREAEQASNREKEVLNGKFSRRSDALQELIGELKGLAKHEGYNQDESAQQLDTQSGVDKADIERQSIYTSLGRAQTSATHARQVRDAKHDHLAKITKHKNSLVERSEDVRRLLHPANGTLLAFLRDERPDWHTNIGKVIRPELLHDTSLKPSTLEGAASDSLYGVSLNLDRLSTPEEAQKEERYRQQLSELESDIQLQEDLLVRANKEAASANDSVNEAELAVAQLEHKREGCEELLRNRRNDLDALKTRLGENVYNRKQAHKAQLVIEQKSLDSLKADWKAAIQDIQDSLRDQLNSLSVTYGDLTSQFDDTIDACDRHIKTISDEMQTDIKAAKKDRDNILANKGIDPARFTQLEDELTMLSVRIKETNAKRPLVERYQRWLDHDAGTYKEECEQKVLAAQSALRELNFELSTANEEYKTQSGRLVATKREKETTRRVASDTCVQIKDTLGQIKDITSSRLAKPYELSSLPIVEIQNSIRAYRGSERKLKSGISDLDGVIVSKGHTSISELWARAMIPFNKENATTADVVITALELVNIFTTFMGTHRDQLVNKARNFSKDIKNFYDVLKDADRAIAQQAKEITKYVGSDLELRGVSDSQVVISSQIKTREYWPLLTRFDEQYSDWVETGYTDLPSDEFVEVLSQVVAALTPKHLKPRISDLLEIEIQLVEGNDKLVIRSDAQLSGSSSHGMAYLILIKFMLAFCRMIKGKSQVRINWPVDELLTLHVDMIKKLFESCDRNQISILGAFPNPVSDIMRLFDVHYLINEKTRTLCSMLVEESELSKRLDEIKKLELSA